jgi:hypothetical protein
MVATSKTRNKLEKLRTYAERDYGVESDNAIRIIEKILKDYNITDFDYTPYNEKKKEKQINTGNLRERSHNKNHSDSFVFPYSRRMKSVLKVFIAGKASGFSSDLIYDWDGSKLTIRCTPYYFEMLKQDWEVVRTMFIKVEKQLIKEMENFARSI